MDIVFIFWFLSQEAYILIFYNGFVRTQLNYSVAHGLTNKIFVRQCLNNLKHHDAKPYKWKFVTTSAIAFVPILSILGFIGGDWWKYELIFSY